MSSDTVYTKLTFLVPGAPPTLLRVPPPFSGPVLLSELVDRARSCTLKLPFFFSLRNEIFF